MVYTYSLSIQEVEAGRLQVQDQLWLYNENLSKTNKNKEMQDDQIVIVRIHGRLTELTFREVLRWLPTE